MDLYASAALTGLGYSLQKQRDTLKRQEGLNPTAPPRETPSMRNMYSSDHWSQVREDERTRGMSMWNKAQNPWDTGVVARPAYASMFAAPAPSGNPSKQIQSLTGQMVNAEDFTHNNMQPFFRGTLRQNVDPNANVGVLENFTGRGDLIQTRKKEVEAFFEPTGGYGNVCGMAPTAESMARHIITPNARNNDFPIEPIRVGPGLNAGFTANPMGGFQQASTLDYIRPKTVDELRVASKPKTSFQIPVQAPAKGTTQRGTIGKLDKNRAETYYEQTPDMLLRTTGAVLKEKTRPIVDVKPTARVDTHLEYKGHVNAAATKPGMGMDTDHGKSAIMVYDNERQVTETRTVVTNLTSTVKAIVAPLLDIFRSTKAEYTIDAPRIFGNMQAQIPSKPTTYDPVNHMMRTTIKETTIHDTTVANLKGAEQGTVHVQDETKKTVRETLPVEDVVRNVAAHTYKVTVYNVDEVAKKTVRETLPESGSAYGFIGGDVTERRGAYEHISVEMPNTQKQFMSDYEYEGIAGSKTEHRPRNRYAEQNAEIDGTREAINLAMGHTPNGAGAFESLPPETVEITTRKPAIDSMASRESGNITRVIQPTSVPPIGLCEITEPADPMRSVENIRLDQQMLEPLKTNPYHLSINM